MIISNDTTNHYSQHLADNKVDDNLRQYGTIITYRSANNANMA